MNECGMTGLGQRMFYLHLVCCGLGWTGGNGSKEGLCAGQAKGGPKFQGREKREDEVKFGQVKEVNTLSRLVSGYKRFSQSCMRQRIEIWRDCIWPCESPILW